MHRTTFFFSDLNESAFFLKIFFGLQITYKNGNLEFVEYCSLFFLDHSENLFQISYQLANFPIL